jgi:glucans biosynthesis protein C
MKAKRIIYVDVIKVFLTCMVVAHHAGQAYGPTGGVWVVKDSASADWLGKFFFINASYMMGLYFFISGYFMMFSLGRKSNLSFIKDRLLRLGIPLLVFTFLVFLPFNYSGAAPGTRLFPFFLDTYFNQSPIATGHLWFVASLLVYSIIYVLIFRRRPKNIDVTNTPKPFRFGYILIYVVLLTIISSWVRLSYPIDTWKTWLIPVEVAHLPQYFSLFLIGTVFSHYRWLDTLKLSWGFLFFLLAAGVYITNESLSYKIKDHWLAESFVEALLCVGISMALLTFFRHFGNRTNRLINLLSDNAYGIYLFHLLIVIALQNSILYWPANANIKFLVVTFSGILFSLGLSALLRKNKWIRAVI